MPFPVPKTKTSGGPPFLTRNLCTKARLRRVAGKVESLKQTGNLSRVRSSRLNTPYRHTYTASRTGRCDALFIAKSRNIAVHVPLTWEEAQTGGLKNVSVAEREETISVPVGVANGDQRRFPLPGAPGNGKTPAGDLLVTFKVAPPPANVVEEQRRRYRRTIVIIVPLIICVSGLVYGSISYRRVWVPNEIGNHWPPGKN